MPASPTALTLGRIFHLLLRQTEDILTSIFWMLGLGLSAPDHRTLSRRGQVLSVALRRAPKNEAIHLIVDSTGLSIVGEGELAAAKHGSHGKRGGRVKRSRGAPGIGSRSGCPPGPGCRCATASP